MDFSGKVRQTTIFTITNFKIMDIEKSEKNQRLRLVGMTLPLTAGGFIVSFVYYFSHLYSFYFFRAEIWMLMGYGFIAFSAVIILMTYLQLGLEGFVFSSRSERSEEHHDYRIERLQDGLTVVKEKLGHLSRQLEGQPNAFLTEEDREKIVSQVRASFVADANETVFAEFKEYANREIQESLKQRDVREMLRMSRLRLETELAALGWRGNLNLAFGAITTIVGLAILGTSVYSEVTENRDPWSFANHFLPRFTLVIFIEIFAYFFLSLYRTSLQEIKYFQNELTNVESKQTALIAALNMGDLVAVNKVLTALAETERNHIISKDQTTVELEKVRVDRASNSDMLKMITELFQKKSG